MAFLYQIFKFLTSKRMNFKPIFTVFVLFISLHLSAQELTLKLSQYPNKEAVIVAVHGIRKDTLGIVPLEQNGKELLAIKTKQLLAALVTLAADTKQETYINTTPPFPWKDKYCNVDGLSSM